VSWWCAGNPRARIAKLGLERPGAFPRK